MKRCVLFFILLFASVTQAQMIHTLSFDRFTHYSIKDWITYAPAAVITTIDVGDDYIYFGTERGGILRYQRDNREWEFPFTTSSGLRSNRIIDLSYQPSQRLFARTAAGIDVYNPGFRYWRSASREDLPPKRRPDEHEVQDYRQRKNYDFPAYYRPLLSELPNFFTDRKYVFISPNEIQDNFNRIFHLNGPAVADTYRNLWLGTDGLGVARASIGNLNLKIEQRSLSNISPRDIYFDKNSIWIGGVGLGREPAGINRWFDSKDKWRTYEARYIMDIYNDNILCIAGNRRYIFFGSEYGLVRFDKKKTEWRTFTPAQRLRDDRVYDLQFWRNQLFIATASGINWMTPGSSFLNQSDDNTLNSIRVFKIVPLDSTVLLATPYGMYEYDPETDKIKFFQINAAIADVNITAAAVNHNSLWLAGQQGITVMDLNSGNWFSFTQIQSQLQTVFHDVAFTGNIVWFASDAGLLKYDTKKNYWYLYTQRDGLAANAVYHIDVDGDNLWLSTSAGVTIFQWYREGRIE